MKPIVLATDGSSSAAEATLHAVELARALSVPLLAVTVEHVSVPSYGYFGYGEVLTELTKIEREHVESTLEQTRTIAAEAGVECHAFQATGIVTEEICRLAKERDAQMIVIGAHGWSPVGRLLHGSVSAGVLQDAPCPVLVVRGGPETTADARIELHDPVAA